MELGPPRGMRDFYPEDAAARNALFDLWRQAAALHGFEEYDAPVVETEELLVRKAGEEIVHQIYRFEDKSGRPLALRPEITPSLARMVIARQNTLALPLKWFSIPQCFRYERTTKGRKREHYQWNLDIVGEEKVFAEAEVLSAAITALLLAGLQRGEFFVHVGNRALLGDLFQASGIPLDRFAPVCLALDKRDKQPPEAIAALLEAEQFDQSQIDRTFEILKIERLDQAEAFLGGSPRSVQDVRDLFQVMESYGLADVLRFDISIVRGLAYYTGIVFEAFDAQRAFRAIFGGGRYDNLLSALGGSRVPSVGLGFGDVVVAELLASLGRKLAARSRLDVQIGFMSEDERPLALRGASVLRQARRSVNLELAPQKPKKFFARAARSGARYAIFIGPAEREEGLFTVKNLAAETQEKVPEAALAERIPAQA